MRGYQVVNGRVSRIRYAPRPAPAPKPIQTPIQQPPESIAVF